MLTLCRFYASVVDAGHEFVACVVDTGDEIFADVSYITNIGEDCIAGIADAVEHTLEMSADRHHLERKNH